MAGVLTSRSGKILLASVLLLGAGALAYWNLKQQPISQNVNFVCVATGQLFALDRKDVVALPARNPKTGEDTLLPCVRDADGVLRVSGRYGAALQQLGAKNRYVDPETLVVRRPP